MRAKIELECVRFVNDEVRMARTMGAEQGREVTVDFDRVQFAAPREQREGQGTATGSDFHAGARRAAVQ